MSINILRVRRQSLVHALLNTPRDKPARYNEWRVLGPLNDWFHAYKNWEADDRFEVACREGRMAIRQSVMEGMVPDSVVAGLGMRGKDELVTAQNTTYKDYRSNVGLSGLKDRMNPDKFKPVEQPYDTGTYREWRGKYYWGLHDLSASLFNPTKPTISEQCRWKEDGNGRKDGKFNNWYLVFMPLAGQEEVALFLYMRKLAHPMKTGGAFPEALARISKRMTRITYAQEADMGAGFVSIGHKGEGADQLPKFRYGAGDVQTETVDGREVPRHVPNISAERAQKARDYNRLLLLQTEKGSTSNEIILRVRHHEGDRFPIITKWNDQRKGFECKPDEPGTQYIPGGFIPDHWASVRQT
jgi:hypothetical protein